MIYLKSMKGQHILILEPENLRRLKKGEPVVSVDQEVVLAYTPDLMWVAEQFKFLNEKLDRDNMVEILKKGKNREPVFSRPHHETIELVVHKEKNDQG